MPYWERGTEEERLVCLPNNGFLIGGVNSLVDGGCVENYVEITVRFSYPSVFKGNNQLL